MSVARANQGSS